MAEASVAKVNKPIYTLVVTLSKDEAELLKAIFQNPIMEHESSLERDLRQTMFEALCKEV